MSEVSVFVGLGSNLGDPQHQLTTALEALGEIELTRMVKASSLYISPPMGPQDQPQFINAVAELATELAPEQLLDKLQQIESNHKRKRGQHWGPRTLDLDLLLYADEIIDLPRLKVPHPGIAERAFVLLPLVEIAPHIDIPGLDSATSLLSAIDAAGVTLVSAV